MNVEIRDLPRQPYWGVQVKVAPADVGRAVPSALAAIYGSIAAAGRTAAGPPFLTDVQVAGDDISFEVGVPCDDPPVVTDGVRDGELAACRAAVYLHRGAYEELEKIYAELQSWIQTNGYRATGAVREVYLTAPDDPRGLMTEVICPIVEAPSRIETRDGAGV